MKHLLFLLLFVVVGSVVNAQYCTPSANCSGDDFIDNFTFNTISNINTGCNGQTDSYINTGLSTDVFKGLSYNTTVQAGPQWSEGFAIWTDFNQDDDFDDAGEMVYASPNAATTQFSGTIDIPNSAATGVTRMRVRCKYGQVPDPGESCTSFTYGETEDYNVNIQVNAIPPVASFSSNSTTNCSGTINFYDNSSNTPTSWLWDFGDGTTSTDQNPIHTYSGNGTFTVSLTVTNQFGSDDATIVDMITISSGVNTPIAATCYPATTDGGQGFGITNVSFNTINNTSGDASNGYEDFTCSQTTVFAGQTYDISVLTDSPDAHNVRGWIDYNNDGNFSANELVLSKDASTFCEDSITIPSAVVLDEPLRMRIAADWQLLAAPTNCVDLEYGQAEDYTVIIEENVTPPVANFNSDATITCDGQVTFTDLSSNVPTFWFWDFGDGNSSTDQNPTHDYGAVNGTFTVSLVVTNAYGNDTLEYVDMIVVNALGQVTAPTCSPVTTAHCCDYGIVGFVFNTINNPTNGGADSYQDYSCEHQTNVEAGFRYDIEIRTGPDNPEDVYVFIDLTNDGDFDDADELVYFSGNAKVHAGSFCMPIPQVYDTPLRMRVASDLVGAAITGCSDVQWGQVEDYAVIIEGNNSAPQVIIAADVQVSCDGFINFTDETCGNNLSWLWNFGDGNSSTDQNPQHTYTTPGFFDVELTVTNSNGTSTETFTDFVEVISLFGAPVPINCTPQTTQYCCGVGVHRVDFGTIDNSSVDGAAGYEDFSCTHQAIFTKGETYPVTITTGPDFDEDVLIYVDWDNDGEFSMFGGNEQAMQSSNQTEFHFGSINIPNNAVTDEPLRMRVLSDFSGNVWGPCNDIQYGQAEDYSIIIQNENSPPISNFEANKTCTENGVIQFTSMSSASATSFDWNFGDGSTSTQENPTHTYSLLGNYTVSLEVSNSNGTDILTKTNYIEFTTNCDVGIEEETQPMTLKVYPNPTEGLVSVKLTSTNSGNVSLHLYDMVGKQQLERSFINTNNLSTELDLRAMPHGVYFLSVQNEATKIVKRIIVQ